MSARTIRNCANFIQKMTGSPVQFELTTKARKILWTWLERRGGSVDEWVTVIDLDAADYRTYSMRRTKASVIDKAAGNLSAVQILLAHSNIENTVRYLGVDIEDALTVAELTEI